MSRIPNCGSGSTRHEGVAWLELDYDFDPNQLTGQYYTDRMTAGTIMRGGCTMSSRN